jgi:hypothetical protein
LRSASRACASSERSFVTSIPNAHTPTRSSGSIGQCENRHWIRRSFRQSASGFS